MRCFWNSKYLTKVWRTQKGCILLICIKRLENDGSRVPGSQNFGVTKTGITSNMTVFPHGKSHGIHPWGIKSTCSRLMLPDVVVEAIVFLSPLCDHPTTPAVIC